MNTILDLYHKFVSDTSFNVADAGAGGITVATLVQVLPTVSVVLSIIWVALRIYVSVRDDLIRKDKKDGNK